MSWTQETVIKLIKEYREHNILWDPSNPNYFNKLLKAQAWKEIAEEMDVPEAAVKSKVESFLAQLRRERAKMVKMTKRGVRFTSSWYGFEHLRFLLNKRKHCFCSDTNENNTSEIQDLQVPQTNNLLNESNKLKRPAEKMLAPKKKNVDTENRSMKKSVVMVKRIKKSVDTKNQKLNSVDTDNRMMKSAYSILPSTSNTVKDVLAKPATDSSATNADQIYANFIATKFRMYSQRTKNVLQYKISNLLFQADTGVFDNYATHQEKPRASRTASRQSRANESDSPTSSPENKRAQRTSSEDRTPITLKIEDSNESGDPLNDDYEDLIEW